MRSITTLPLPPRAGKSILGLCTISLQVVCLQFETGFNSYSYLLLLAQLLILSKYY